MSGDYGKAGLWRDALGRGLDLGSKALPELLRAPLRNWYLNSVYYRLYPEKRPLQPGDTTPFAPFHRYRELLRGGSQVDLSRIETSSIPGLISVVLPVFNQGRYVRKAIDSVLAQERVQFELIIVDDGSDDETPAILHSYRAHPQVEIVKQPNRGLPAALNAGFARASGELLTWTSSDNVMAPCQLAEQANVLAASGDLQAVYGDMRLIDAEDSPLRVSASFREFQAPTDGSVIRLPRVADRLQAAAYNFIGGRFLYRAWAARIIGAYDQAWPLVEDYDYWLRLSAWFNIAHDGVDRSLYRYRLHADSLGSMQREQVTRQTYSLLETDARRRTAWLNPVPLCTLASGDGFVHLARYFERSEGCKQGDAQSRLWVLTKADEWPEVRGLAHSRDIVAGVAFTETDKTRLFKVLPPEAWLIEVGVGSRVAGRHRVLGLPTAASLSFLLRAIYCAALASSDASSPSHAARLAARH